MSSTAKTLGLLSFFSAARPEIGLSQLCRLAHRDKATTYRHLQALEESGFIEQNPKSKHYRLGPAILHLAQIREITVPRKLGAQTALATLAESTGETAHVSVLSGTNVFPLASCESPRHSIRAIIDVQTFPLHATASGLCALAFGPSELIKSAMNNMQVFTSTTAKNASELNCAVFSARDTGFGFSDRSFEDEIQSLSAPIFDHTDLFAGAVSVAGVATRFTDKLERIIKQNLMIASRDITKNWGGKVPDQIEDAWSKSLYHCDETETGT